MARFTGVLGLLTMLLLAWIFSTNRRAIRWRTVGWGLSLQIVFAVLVLEWTVGQRILGSVGAAITRMLGYSFAGSQIRLRRTRQAALVDGFDLRLPGAADHHLYLRVLRGAYHIGVMQFVIRISRPSHARRWASGAEWLNVAASIFMGQTEAPLTIRPFLPGATRSELMTIMTTGMAHVSGGIMARLYFVRNRSPAPAHGRHYDCSRHHPHLQNAGA